MEILLDFLLKYWYLVPIAVLATLVLFLSILGIRKYRKEKRQAEQIKKTNGSPAVPPRGKADEEEQRWYSGYTKYSWTIVLSLAGAGVFYWGLYTKGLRFSQVGDWSWDNWLLLLVFAGIVFALIKLNEKALGTMAGTLQSVLVGAMFVMFFGIPAGIWVRDIFLPQVICKDVSAHETRTCALNTAWSSWIKAAEGPAVDGMRMCFTPGGQIDRKDVNGTTFFRFKSDEGKLVKAYRLMPDNSEKKCPPTLP